MDFAPQFDEYWGTKSMISFNDTIHIICIFYCLLKQARLIAENNYF